VLARFRAGDFFPTRSRNTSTRLHKLADGMRESTETASTACSTRKTLHARVPIRREPSRRPRRRRPPWPVLNLAPLDNALAAVEKNPRRPATPLRPQPSRGDLKTLRVHSATEPQTACSARSSKTLTKPEGPARTRTGFKHMVYAPGLKTGYAVKTLPGRPAKPSRNRRWPDAEKICRCDRRIARRPIPTNSTRSRSCLKSGG